MDISLKIVLESFCAIFCLAGHVTLGWNCNDKTTRAVCYLQPNPSLPPSDIRGKITFEQRTNCIDGYPNRYPLVVKAEITGLPSARQDDFRSYLGFHVHQLGTMSPGCESMGGHYNPFRTSHGSRQSSIYTRHVGDFGNVRVDHYGHVQESFKDNIANLVGLGAYSIMGRGIVLHEGTDDLGLNANAGSKKTGNAGRRIACCVIQPVH